LFLGRNAQAKQKAVVVTHIVDHVKQTETETSKARQHHHTDDIWPAENDMNWTTTFFKYSMLTPYNNKAKHRGMIGMFQSKPKFVFSALTWATIRFLILEMRLFGCWFLPMAKFVFSFLRCVFWCCLRAYTRRDVPRAFPVVRVGTFPFPNELASPVIAPTAV
jgi:hypothetical protein